MQNVLFSDLGEMDYLTAWNYQEQLLQHNVNIKQQNSSNQLQPGYPENDAFTATSNYLLFLEHPPVYTLGKSGHIENVLISEKEMGDRGISFYKSNRGGDITFHGPGQLVGYPILDLENFGTDIGHYLRNLEEVVIRTMAVYGLEGVRSKGETGVWLQPEVNGRERKICAMGVRCSRWITMHGFAFNINTDLSYFDHIIPCGIHNKSVTSLARELGRQVAMSEVKKLLREKFEEVFKVRLEESPLICAAGIL